MQHYTNQLAKDTNKYIKDLAHTPAAPTQSEQKQRRMHKDRLMNEFSTALNNFQVAQRNAAEKEKASVKRARAASGLSVSDYIFHCCLHRQLCDDQDRFMRIQNFRGIL